MKETIDRLRRTGEERIAAAADPAALEAVRVQLLGRKGEVTLLLRGLKDVAAEQILTTGKQFGFHLVGLPSST